MKKKIYAVKTGRKIGIFKEWQKCYEQIDQYPDGEFLSFAYCSDLEDAPEDVSGSLRYAIKEAKEFLGDLVYLGESADCLEDAGWVEDGFLPFGHEPDAEDAAFCSDENEACDEEEVNIEDIEEYEDFGYFEEEPDAWSMDNGNAPGEQGESWEIEYWKIAADMQHCVYLIRFGRSVSEKKTAASDLKNQLERCLDDVNLIDLTASYKNLRVDNAIGYDPIAVSRFVRAMADRYPRPL